LRVDADGKPFTELIHFGSGGWLGIKITKTLISVWFYSSTAKILSSGGTPPRVSTLISHHVPASVYYLTDIMHIAFGYIVYIHVFHHNNVFLRICIFILVGNRSSKRVIVEDASNP